jgi:GT2 family glycosyltransferase
MLLQALVPQVHEKDGREIVIVNDGSHDADYERVLQPYRDSVLYHPLEKNVGIAAARNISAGLARNNYLVFTDDDTVPPARWLDWLSMRLMEHPELDVVAGTTKPLWPENPSFFAKVRAEHDLIPTTEDTGGTIIFPTANVAVRRTLFEEMGGFGFPDFSGAGEDTEFATRLFHRGALMRTDKSWATHHEVTEGLWALCKRYRRYGYANGRLALLTTSPAEHDYMLDTGNARWRTIWNWEYAHLIKHARSVHKSRFIAVASATLACIVKMAYWQGIKDARGILPAG